MVSPSEVPRRRNGLTPPYSAPQIVSWLFLAATIIHFVLFITPILPFEAAIAVTIFFFLVVACVFHYGMRAIAVDSMDIYLKKTLAEDRDGVIKTEGKVLDHCYKAYNGDAVTIKNEQPPEGEETKQCWICDTQVAEHSMHCKYCNKCVTNFDHHCLWLNTCIGAKNYKDFFRVMLSIAFMQVVHLGVSAYLVIDIFLHGPTEDRADDWLGTSGDTSIAVTAVLIFFMVFDICSLILLAQLIAFHVHLQKERITTYQFIVQDSQKRREKAKMKLELDQMRMTELARAQEQGESWYAMRLRMGGSCRKCGCAALDPLDMPQPPPEPDPNQGFSTALGGNLTGTTDTPEQPSDGGMENGNHDNYQDEHRNDDDEDFDNHATPYQNGNGNPGTNGVAFVPVDPNGMTSERHELDSQASQSELGDPEDLVLTTPTGADAQDGGLLGANPRDDDDDEEDDVIGGGV
eukprot:CAMPEP_0172451864 /NCGR_PEP_ID=MMETSP1065-20121228/9712_1 /TAXON_ID=265537 /ORGANISM="Amphiprora paludosa, Strain CCMP125" /LENGTH=460 /DNA_ID=CAMNT_0013203835 /DNA_START=106 /DNA_END=1488 /DNA_ORIENTATION=-